MDNNKVIPLRTTHRNKEARLARVRGRFDQAHPETAAPNKRSSGSGKALLVALVIAALMIWLATWLGR